MKETSGSVSEQVQQSIEQIKHSPIAIAFQERLFSFLTRFESPNVGIEPHTPLITLIGQNLLQDIRDRITDITQNQ